MTIARDKANSTVTNFASTGIDDNASSTAVTVDSSGNLLVGGTAADAATSTTIYSNGQIRANTSSINVAILDRRNSDGGILELKKDDSTVGSIGTLSSRIFIGSGDTGIYFNPNADVLQPWNPDSNALRDNAIDLGNSLARFKDLYLSGGVYLGGTGSANKLDDYEEGTWTPTISGITSASEIKSGWYYKIGGIVTVQCVISLPSASKTSSDVQISGFPFTASQSVCGNYHFVNSYQNHFADPQTNGSFSKYLNHTYTTSMQKYDGTQLIGTDVAGSSPELYLYVVYPT